MPRPVASLRFLCVGASRAVVPADFLQLRNWLAVVALGGCAGGIEVHAVFVDAGKDDGDDDIVFLSHVCFPSR